MGSLPSTTASTSTEFSVANFTKVPESKFLKMPQASSNFSRVKVALLFHFWLYFGDFQIEIVGNTDVRTLLPLLLLLFRWSYGTYSNIESWQLSSFIFCFYSLPSSYYFYACTEYIFLHNMYSTMNTQSYIEKKKSIILTFDKKRRWRQVQF